MNMEMTQEWIRNYNKKCAEFLGWKYDSKTSIHFTKGTWIDNKNIGHCAERGLSFHSDWNWIMEVCIKLGMEFVTTNKKQLILEVYDKLRSMETNT